VARQVINTGSTLGDRTGDNGRVAFTKVNENFAEVYTGVDGLDTAVAEIVSDVATLQSDVDVLEAASGLHYPEIAAEAGVTIVSDGYPVGNIWRYKSGSLLLDATNDWSAAIQAACDVALAGGPPVTIPQASAWVANGFYRCNSTITLTHGIQIACPGEMAAVVFYACDGFVAAAGTAFLKIINLHIILADHTRLYKGISIEGTVGSQCNYNEIRSCFLQGWDECISMDYTWFSIIDSCITQDADTAVRMFGQCVENKITNCTLVVNDGVQSVELIKDGGTFGEGTHISDSLLGNGQYGITSEGHLSLSVTNNVIDQITDVAVALSDSWATTISNNWLYATNYGIQWVDLGAPQNQATSVMGNYITTTAASGVDLYVGANNGGITAMGNSLTSLGVTSRCVVVLADAYNVNISGNALNNAGSSAAMYSEIASFTHNGNFNNVTMEYISSPSFVGSLTGCTTVPTGTIEYRVQGDMVLLEIPVITGTSNTNACTITGVPAALRPTESQAIIGVVTKDNDVEAISRMFIETDGTITLHYGLTAAFTAPGVKGISACVVPYMKA
jgi:hypothetical protein